ncbi:polyketide cyclase [Azospirillum thiophilum]|uniref:Polyketide cyclase n=1 Tax=Azospirillum thiophilum TaxID=528244 RepID=A0AAC8ZWV9_9PROT|nr:nuclear transport factor 2 family protein [Azospirillum thiophilum]ALG75220.1 polyketide cyclase [Azospirillum thiophilum]KJR62616.1 polyketide cyclase [Azospirillum thiophilum]
MTLPLPADLAVRLARFEAEAAVRACMVRYMALCDALGPATPLDELAGLFTVDAVWEGIGEKYAKTFGRIAGRAALREMFAGYMVEPSHFALNVHFLTSELIRTTGPETAEGTWIMLQTSTFASGASHLNAARLTVDFRLEDGAWRMSHFRTENLFSRPVDGWNRPDPVPVPAPIPAPE